MTLPFRIPLMALALAAAPTMAGCNDVTLPRVPGEYVFEVETANFAWAPYRAGIVVDAAGDVWSYDDGGDAKPADEPAVWTGAQLAAKYAHGGHLLRHLTPDEVAAHAALIDAADGPLGPPVSRCADAGGTTFTAFRYDVAADAYRPVLLHQQGDVARRNPSPAAGELTNWLRSMDSRLQGLDCEP